MSDPLLEYVELAACGHEPWLERATRTSFARIVTAWILARGAAPSEVPP